MRAAVATAAALLLGAALTACASDRYVGSIGETHTYSNRGYGFTVDLAKAGVLDRWRVIDPRDPWAEPPATRPVVMDSPLDLDGDGDQRNFETFRHLLPMLRLVSKTSTGAQVDLNVEIRGGKTKRLRPLDELIRDEARFISRAEIGVTEPERFQVPPGFEGRAIEIPQSTTNIGAAFRIALIDQPDFAGEVGPRRQLVSVVLTAPEITEPLRADHLRIVQAIILSRRAAPLEDREKP